MVKGGARPCDDNFAAVISSSEFLQYLRHRPLAAGASSDEPPAKVPRTGKGDKGKGSKGRGKASGQRAPSNTSVRIPADLLAMGCVACAPKGHRLCFDYSVGLCQRSPFVRHQVLPQGSSCLRMPAKEERVTGDRSRQTSGARRRCAVCWRRNLQCGEPAKQSPVRASIQSCQNFGSACPCKCFGFAVLQ